MHDGKQEYKKRVGDYLSAFTSESGKRVLRDMRRSYCRGAFDSNPYIMARNEGRREMVEAIEAMLIAGRNPKLIDDLFKQPEDEGFEF